MSKYFKAYNAVKNLIKGSNTSPTISSVKPSVHKTKKGQKTSEMKIQFDKQKNRTISDRNKASAETFDTSKGKGKDIQKRNEATKKMFDDANGRTKKADGGPLKIDYSIPRGGFSEKQIEDMKERLKNSPKRRRITPLAPTLKDIKKYRDESRARIREEGRTKTAKKD